MTAVYSHMLFADESLYPMALAHQKHYDITLVTGLDLPWVADGLQRDGPQVRGPVDTLVRQALERSGIHYRVVYGQGPQRLNNALMALGLQGEDEQARQLREQAEHMDAPDRCHPCTKTLTPQGPSTTSRQSLSCDWLSGLALPVQPCEPQRGQEPRVADLFIGIVIVAEAIDH